MGRISPRVQFPKSVNLNGAGYFLALICGCCRVTLVVAFGFLPQILRWQGPTNGTLSFYECGYHGYSDPTHCNQIRLNVLHSGSGVAKRSSLRPKTWQEPLSETYTTFNFIFPFFSDFWQHHWVYQYQFQNKHFTKRQISISTQLDSPLSV